MIHPASIAPYYTASLPRSATASHAVRDVPLGVHQEVARDKYDPFVGAATGGRGQFRFGGIRDVYADYGEIAGFQFQDVGAIVERDRLCAVGVWVGADSAEKHISSYSVFNFARHSDARWTPFIIEHIRCQELRKRGFKYGVTDRQMLRQIGKNVKAARMKADVTQECLAELVGVHWQTISYLENGRYPFSVVTFTRISQALGISANRLLDGLPVPEPAGMESIKRALARKRKPKNI